MKINLQNNPMDFIPTLFKTKKLHRYICNLIIFVTLISFSISCGNNDKVDMSQDKEFQKFLNEIESKLKVAYNNYAEAYFKATISGKEEDYKKYSKLEQNLNELYSNKEDFKKLKKFKDDNLLSNDTLKRALIVLYNSYAGKQVDTNFLNKISSLSSNIENKFATFRANYDNKKLTDNEIENILKTETDSKKLENVWLAHKEIGNVVSKDIIKLVKLRNESAKQLGYKNYHQMNLILGEQDPDELEEFFDELDNLTRNSFAKLKDEIDTFLSQKYNINKSELRPWHYNNRYFQEAPKIYDLDLDKYYKNVNIEKTTINFFNGIGTPIDDMVKKSDLYEKEGKYQHAYCTDIDRDKRDVRVVCNIVNNHSWMGTMLHEYGHAVYQKYVGENLPWSLKVPTHTFATEGIAMLYGRFATKSEWMYDMNIINNEEANNISEKCRKILKLDQLVFSRWVQVVYRFEKEMYENPDQDLNKLWWELVEKYQMMKKPDNRNSPDWATKIHIALYPCYYHNYLLGEIFASQFYAHINNKVLGNEENRFSSFVGKEKSAKFLVEKVYIPANLYHWKDLIKNATGEEFTPKYYAKEFGIK